MINIIHPKRRAGAFFFFFGNARFSDLAKIVDFQCIACVSKTCSSATLLWPKVFCGRGRYFAPIESSSGIVCRIENLTKLLKIPHSQKARGLSRAGMILMVGIGQYWLIYIETKFSEWLLVWQCVVDQRCFKSPGEQISSSKFGGCEFRPDHQIWSYDQSNERTPPSSFSTSSQGLTSLSKFAGFVLGAGLENKDAYFLRFYSCLFEILPLSISSLLSKGSLN